jgi:hypothetical protein
MLYRGVPGTSFSDEETPAVPQANPAAFQAAGRVPFCRLLDVLSLPLDDFFPSLFRRVVSISFRLSGLDPPDVVFASGVLDSGLGDTGFCETGEDGDGSLLCDCNGGSKPDLDEAVDLTGRVNGFDRSK